MTNTSIQATQNGTGRRAGPPSSNSTRSYWHRDPSERLLGHRTTNELPTTADVVVIGSGITGTFAARELVAGGRSVLMLEAREACWGATGRNGGHCQPAAWDASADVARFELGTFNLIADLVAKYNIPCDWQVIGGVHPIFSEEVLEAAKQQMKRLQRYPDLQDKAILIQDKEELARKHVPQAIAAVYQPNAAKCWPYKLVTWILESLLDQHDAPMFNLQTNTLVDRLERGQSSWSLHTQRGQVHARHVLLATNAYTSHLVPEMTGLITPVRGQVCALEPPAGSTQLPHSYVWMKGADHQYLIHRGPEDTQDRSTGSTDRSIIFGGERLAERLDGEEGVWSDDEINPIISQALHRCVSDALKLPLEDGKRTEAQVLDANYEWTGIMGYSSDGGPWVGRLHGSLLGNSSGDGGSEAETAGLWISAGFTGHGMPVAARCGAAVAEMILGRQGGIQVPDAWGVSEERVMAARGLPIPQTLGELLNELPTE
ncbi:FAD dependent oxidoreductase [Fusarium austroafricanum]|uniref:FAD dependent oxidoreductase n=1 Tax=Fusarium austroafricanum TaxID=2364996 RepID=A0A8H4JUM7_9HYPO|nr:FAD dependent oxidoreductase [Fusarium austroafricanum]